MWQAETAPVSACLIKRGDGFFLKNKKNGGTKDPPALIQLITVMRDPLSADVMYPIYLFPFAANIFVCLLCTKETLV